MLKRGFLASVVAQLSGRVGSIIANMIMLGLVARHLSESAFGEVMFILTFINIFVQLADFGTNAALSKLAAGDGVHAQALWGNFLTVRMQLALLATFLALIIGMYLGKTSASMIVIGALTIPFAGSRFFDPVFQVCGRPWLSTQALGIYSLGMLALTGLTALLNGNQTTFLCAYGLANVIYCITAWRGANTCIRADWSSKQALRRQIWAIAVPVGISGVFTTLNSRANVMIIEHYGSFLEVGLFAGATRILDLGVSVTAMLLGPLVPIFSAQASNHARLKALYLEIFKWIAILLLPMMLTASLWAPTLVQLLYGQKYLAAAPIVAVLAAMGALAALCLLNSYILLALNQVRFGIWLTALAAVMSIILNIWLVPRSGFMASAWISLGIEAMMCAVTFWILIAELGNVFEGRVWNRLGLASGLLVVVAHSGLITHPLLALIAGLAVFVITGLATGLLTPSRERLAALRR